MGIGPQLPSHLQGKRKHEDDDEESSSDSGSDAGPQRPEPDSKRPKTSGPLRPVVGPAPPPAALGGRSSPGTNMSSDDSSDDDGYGPAPPSADASADVPSTSAFDTAEFEAEQEGQATKRDDWMMAPPKQGDLASRMDPTKLRARGFNTGKSASGAGPTDMSIWTETPDERRKRLQNQVMGVKGDDPSSPKQSRSKNKDKENAEKARKIQEHNNKFRPRSLLEQHKKGVAREEEDDPSKRAFDYEKDMAAGTKMGAAARKQMLNKASDFGSRFSKGSYL